MKLHLPKGLRLAVLSCSTGVAVTCPIAQAENIEYTTGTQTWNNNNSHAGDTTTVSGATLKINNTPPATTPTPENPSYNYGAITVQNNGTLELATWTGQNSDIRDVSTSVGATNPTRPVISSDITLNNSRLLFTDGAYEFSGTVTIAGQSTFVNKWSKGHVINTLASSEGNDAQLTYQCSNTDSENASPLTILNEGSFSGRVVMDNQDPQAGRIGYLVLKNANALGDGTTIVDLGSGAHDTRNHLSADTATINLKGLAGKGVVEICSLTGNAGVASATVNIINSGINEGEKPIAASDVFTGTISEHITVDASRGTLVLGQITNNGALVSGDSGKIVLASDHAGMQWGRVLSASGTQLASGNGFAGASSISLFTKDSTQKTVGGTGEVYFNDKKYSVVNGAISLGDDDIVADYSTYVVRTADANSSELGTAKTTASNHGATLANVKIMDDGMLDIDSGGGDATGFISGNARVEGGGRLKLSVKDALGWGDNKTSSITLEGTAATDSTGAKVATMEIGAVQTLETNINLNGNTLVSATNNNTSHILHTYHGGTISVTGTNNTISAGIMDRDLLTLDLAANATLNITGKVKVASGDGASDSPRMRKTGAGTVTFSGEGSSFSSNYTQSAGETFFSGKNTTLGHGLTINGGRVVIDAGANADAGENNTVTVTGVSGSGRLGVKSGTLKVSGLNTTGLLELGYNPDNNAQQGTGSQVVELSGTGNSVGQLDASMGSSANGTLRMKANSSLQVNETTWLYKNASILLEQGAVLTTNQAIKIAGTQQAEANTTYIRAKDGAADEYTAGNTGITIANAVVTSTKNNTGEDTNGQTLANLLENTTLVNDGSALLKATNKSNTYKGINANAGDILIQRQETAASVSVESLNINAGFTVDIQAGTDAFGILEVASDSSTVTATAVFGENSILNANLVLGSGSSLDMGGAVTLGASSLVLGNNITLGTNLLASIRGLAAGESYGLFTGQETVRLNGTSYSLTGDGIMENVDASTIFNGLDSGSYLLKFDAPVSRAAGNGGVFYIEAVAPEPATATLSLLALAALAARRRRK